MLSGAEFLALFELVQGQYHAGYELSSVQVFVHRTYELNETTYLVELQFTWQGMDDPTLETLATLEAELTNYLEGVRTITIDRRPYKAVIQWPLDTAPGLQVTAGGQRATLLWKGRARRISIREARNLTTGFQ
jgi:hypothetical protein